jgi:multiple sugar transport system substrate-binding protein
MGRMVAIIVALLVVTNVITGLAVYYLAVPAPGAGAVQVIGPWAGGEWANFKPVLDAFKNATGISYQYTTSRQEDLTPTLPINFQAQQSPADLIFMPSATIKQYAGRGWVADLTGTLSPSSYQPGALNPLTVSGKIWGGAYTGKVKPGFWYNSSFFTSHPSLTIPTTWAGFTQLLWNIKNTSGVLKPILSGDGVGWPLSDVTEAFIETYGGAAMHQALTNRTLKWTDPSVEAIFQNYLVPTLTDGFWSAPQTWNDPAVISSWWNGQYPLYFMGSWITSGFVPNPGNIKVLSLPGGVSNQGIVFAADYFFVPKFAAHSDLGKRLAVWLGSKDAQTIQVGVGGHIATAANVPLSAYPALDAQVASLMTGKTVLTDLDDTIGNPFQGKFWTQLQGLWANPGTWQTVLANIEAAAEAQP